MSAPKEAMMTPGIAFLVIDGHPTMYRQCEFVENPELIIATAGGPHVGFKAIGGVVPEHVYDAVITAHKMVAEAIDPQEESQP